MVYTGLVTLRNFPNSGDEYAYLLSATLFTERRLAAPSPEPREFFNVNHVVNDGHFYGKYPPGWPLLLSVGVILGLPWAVNMIFGTMTIVLLWRIALSHFGTLAAHFLMCCLIFSPYLIFTSSSYFSHSSCLFFIVVFIYFFYRCLDQPEATANFVGMGASAGAAFLIRPYSTIGALSPLGGYLIVRAVREGRLGSEIRLIAGSLATFAIFLFLFLGYNKLQTGHFFLQPFLKYDPSDTLGFTGAHSDVLARIRTNGVHRLMKFNRWAPMSLLFMTALICPCGLKSVLKPRLLLLPFCGIFISHLFYWGDGVNQYGPRYMYEASGASLLAAGAVLAGFPRAAPIAAVTILTINGYGFVSASRYHSQQIKERMSVYDCSRKLRLSNALVFLRTGSGDMPKGDLARNGTQFDGSVLYVLDRSRHNIEILKRFPHLTPYVFEFDERLRKGRITPLVPAPP